jgi:HSP20 family protein
VGNSGAENPELKMTQGELTMSTYDPIREFNTIRREFEQLFQAFTPVAARTAFLPSLSARAYPSLNIQDTRDDYVVEALAPGLDGSKLDITVQNNKLTIRGEKVAPGENLKPEDWHRNERAAGGFLRSFNLPTAVDGDRVSAEYKNGIIRITLPKREEAKARQIAVTIA